MTPGNISPPGDKENQPITPEMTAISNKANATPLQVIDAPASSVPLSSLNIALNPVEEHISLLNSNTSPAADKHSNVVDSDTSPASAITQSNINNDTSTEVPADSSQALTKDAGDNGLDSSVRDGNDPPEVAPVGNTPILDPSSESAIDDQAMVTKRDMPTAFANVSMLPAWLEQVVPHLRGISGGKNWESLISYWLNVEPHLGSEGVRLLVKVHI